MDSNTPISPPASLKLRDVRSVYRLVGEIREKGDDPGQWRPHLVRRLRTLAAEVVTSSEVHFRQSRHPGVMRVLDSGWGTDAGGTVWAIHTERDDERPETYLLAIGQSPDTSGDGDVALKPSQPVYGGTSFILSQYPLPHISAVDQLGIHRAWGNDRFTAAEHRLVRIFHIELGRLWRKDVIRRAGDPHIDLPPRLKQTLEALVLGSSEKQIAGKLKLSQHTIHNYVKASCIGGLRCPAAGNCCARVNRDKGDFTPRLSMPQEDV